MAAAGDAELRLLLPPGGPCAVRPADDPDTGGAAPHGRPDRLDQHGPQLDARADDDDRRVLRRQVQQKVAHHRIADVLVPDDGGHGLRRQLQAARDRYIGLCVRDVLQVYRDGRRRVVLRAERLRAHRGAPQGDSIRGALGAPGRALHRAHDERCARGLDTARAERERVGGEALRRTGILAASVHHLRRTGVPAGGDVCVLLEGWPRHPGHPRHPGP